MNNKLSTSTVEYFSNHLARETLSLIHLWCEDWRELRITGGVYGIEDELKQLKGMASELGIAESYQERLMFHCATYELEIDTVMAVLDGGLFAILN